MKQFALLLALALIGGGLPCLAAETTPAPKIGTAEVNGARLHYEVLGEGHPLVLIHGGYVDLRMWDDQFTEFARQFRVIRYDTRWHGQSRGAAGEYADHEDLRALLEFLGVEKAAVLGLSMGGRIAIDFALAFPEMVTALMPVAPGLSGFGFEDTRQNENFGPMVAAWQQGEFDRAAEYFQRMWTDGPSRTPEQVDPAVRQRVRTLLVAGCELATRAQGRPREGNAISRLAEIRVPTLVIMGDLDMPDIHTIVGRIEKQVPGVRKVVVPGAAHMVNLERPQEFNEAVVGFLAGLGLTEGN